jgi:hypothetical protein
VRGDQAWVESRINSALAARAVFELPDGEKWIEQVAGSTGLSIALLQQLVELMDAGAVDGSAVEVVAALLAWLSTNPIMLMDLVRPNSLEELFGDKYKKLRDDNERAQHALPVIAKLWPLWMSGVPLCRLEEEFLERRDQLGHCENARRFVSRMVPDLAFCLWPTCAAPCYSPQGRRRRRPDPNCFGKAWRHCPRGLRQPRVACYAAELREDEVAGRGASNLRLHQGVYPRGKPAAKALRRLASACVRPRRLLSSRISELSTLWRTRNDVERLSNKQTAQQREYRSPRTSMAIG